MRKLLVGTPESCNGSVAFVWASAPFECLRLVAIPLSACAGQLVLDYFDYFAIQGRADMRMLVDPYLQQQGAPRNSTRVSVRTLCTPRGAGRGKTRAPQQNMAAYTGGRRWCAASSTGGARAIEIKK